MNNIKSNNGFTILELLIAMVISLTLVFACTSVYSSLKHSITVSQDLADAQEAIRTAHYLMARAIRQAKEVEVDNAAQTLTIIYGESANGGGLHSCVGTIQEENGFDFFWLGTVKGMPFLFCTAKTFDTATTSGASKTYPVVLGITGISASVATLPLRGVEVNLKINGMPGEEAGTLGVDGISFIIAMKDRILAESE